jgi:hypothetical protein
MSHSLLAAAETSHNPRPRLSATTTKRHSSPRQTIFSIAQPTFRMREPSPLIHPSSPLEPDPLFLFCPRLFLPPSNRILLHGHRTEKFYTTDPTGDLLVMALRGTRRGKIFRVDSSVLSGCGGGEKTVELIKERVVEDENGDFERWFGRSTQMKGVTFETETVYGMEAEAEVLDQIFQCIYYRR